MQHLSAELLGRRCIENLAFKAAAPVGKWFRLSSLWNDEVLYGLCVDCTSTLMHFFHLQEIYTNLYRQQQDNRTLHALVGQHDVINCVTMTSAGAGRKVLTALDQYADNSLIVALPSISHAYTSILVYREGTAANCSINSLTSPKLLAQ